MTDRAEVPAPRSPRGCLAPLGAAMVGVIALVAVALGALLGRLSAPAPKPASVTIVRGTPSVVTAIRDLSRLEGAELHVEKVIDLTDKQSRFFGLIEAKDAILLVAAGDVTAGVDLGEISDSDVRVDRDAGAATITLPAAKILSHSLDNEHTYVHSRDTDLLAERKLDLESRAREEAEKAIVEAAEQSDLRTRAEANVKRTIESLLRSLGYPHANVQFRK